MKDKNAYQFIKGRDFYIENGLYVFTEYYLNAVIVVRINVDIVPMDIHLKSLPLMNPSKRM